VGSGASTTARARRGRPRGGVATAIGATAAASSASAAGIGCAASSLAGCVHAGTSTSGACAPRSSSLPRSSSSSSWWVAAGVAGVGSRRARLLGLSSTVDVCTRAPRLAACEGRTPVSGGVTGTPPRNTGLARSIFSLSRAFRMCATVAPRSRHGCATASPPSRTFCLDSVRCCLTTTAASLSLSLSRALCVRGAACHGDAADHAGAFLHGRDCAPAPAPRRRALPTQGLRHVWWWWC
jgi:hypothetical protein